MDSYQEQALAYLKGEMTDEEKQAFEAQLAGSADLRAELESSRELLEILSAANEEATVRHVNAVLQEAVKSRASDIHIIGERKGAAVYYRVDGQMQEVQRLPKELFRRAIDRLKIMAECHVTEREAPQDGRIYLRHEGKDFDFRVNFMPTVYGERFTSRIIDRGSVLLGLENLGLNEAQRTTLERLTELPKGFVLTSGSTGNGKTTLLYSLLMHINQEAAKKRNILTVEDPVEYAFNGISQTAVNKKIGLTFPAALRSFFRCDPDVILSSQMRDLESAELCIEFALTGHLVFSALHVPSGLLLPQRLREMGVVPFLVAETVNGVIGQRVVRKICPSCVEEYTPSSADLEKAGLTVADSPFKKGAGCEACGQRGYKGRVGLFEVLEIDDETRKLVANQAPFDVLWYATFGRNGGSLWHDGRDKVKQGLTTVEEVNRVLFDYPKPS
jgi:general secretion pathway protein E